MYKKLWMLCAAIVLSVNLAYAGEAASKAKVAPAPLFKDPTTGMEFVFVKGGCYLMGDIFGDGTDVPGFGDSNEIPVHEVCVDDFYIGKYEVTQGQWKHIMGNNPSRDSGCREGDYSCPVEFINWNEIQDFINRLNKKDGGARYRLPTEAEWEYAARSGGRSERYPGGNDIDSVAWYTANSPESRTHPVGKKLPNGLGIYDMSGNVWETTGDWYAGDYYSKSPRDNPKGPSTGDHRVIKGGCVSSFLNQRTSRRGAQEPEQHNADGFRLLRVP